MRIAIASDHAGVELKSQLIEAICSLGHEPVDLGPESTDSVDYPDYAGKVVEAVTSGDARFGVLLCGSGIGMSMAANRDARIRAALCHSGLEAELTRKHNDANVLCLGARIIGVEAAKDCLQRFLTTEYEGGRHQRRIDKMS